MKQDYQCDLVAAWIVTYSIQHSGNSPTVQEIADHFGKQKSTIQFHLERLQGEGVVSRVDGKLVILGSGYLPPVWYLNTIGEAEHK